MHVHVAAHVAAGVELLLAVGALEWFFARVNPLVSFEIAFLGELLVAFLTLKLFFTMSVLMCFLRRKSCKGLGAFQAFEGSFLCVM